VTGDKEGQKEAAGGNGIQLEATGGGIEYHDRHPATAGQSSLSAQQLLVKSELKAQPLLGISGLNTQPWLG